MKNIVSRSNFSIKKENSFANPIDAEFCHVFHLSAHVAQRNLLVSDRIYIEISRVLVSSAISHSIIEKKLIVELSRFHKRVDHFICCDNSMSDVGVINLSNPSDISRIDRKPIGRGGYVAVKYTSLRDRKELTYVCALDVFLQRSQLVPECHTNATRTIDPPTLISCCSVFLLPHWDVNSDRNAYTRAKRLNPTRPVSRFQQIQASGSQRHRKRNSERRDANYPSFPIIREDCHKDILA
jgi:hypothetical protein